MTTSDVMAHLPLRTFTCIFTAGSIKSNRAYQMLVDGDRNIKQLINSYHTQPNFIRHKTALRITSIVPIFFLAMLCSNKKHLPHLGLELFWQILLNLPYKRSYWHRLAQYCILCKLYQVFKVWNIYLGCMQLLSRLQKHKCSCHILAVLTADTRPQHPVSLRFLPIKSRLFYSEIIHAIHSYTKSKIWSRFRKVTIHFQIRKKLSVVSKSLKLQLIVSCYMVCR